MQPRPPLRHVDRYKRTSRAGSQAPIPPLPLMGAYADDVYHLDFFLLEDDAAILVQDDLGRQDVIPFDNRVQLEKAWLWVKSRSLGSVAESIRLQGGENE